MSRDHKLIFKGTSKQTNYVGGGKDGKEDYIIDCSQGDTIFVTEEKKAEMLKDHPEWFIEVSKEPNKVKLDIKIPKPESTPEPSPETAISDFESMTNAELRGLAGTDNKRLSKNKLIKMIEAKLNKNKE